MASAAANIADKAKAIITEDTIKVQHLAQDVIKSRAYLYPLKGIFYFASRRSLWKPLLQQLLPTISTAIGVTTFMFLVAYVPQAAVLSVVNGPLAILTTVLLVLSESATITNVITRSFFIEEALVDTFDGTLVEQKQTELVKQGRELKASGGTGDAIARLGKFVRKPLARFSPRAILRYFIYLPLNLIPVVGTVLFVILQARKSGPASHARYFQLRGMNEREREAWTKQRRAAYTGFGIPAVLLEMIPFVGIGFSFTNTVGAALWAADLENGRSAPKDLHQAKEDADKDAAGQESGVIRENKKEL